MELPYVSTVRNARPGALDLVTRQERPYLEALIAREHHNPVGEVLAHPLALTDPRLDALQALDETSYELRLHHSRHA